MTSTLVLSHWKTRKLADCGRWLTGGTPDRGNPAYWNGTIPWISAKSLKSFHVSDSDEHVSHDGAENGSRVVPAGTLLFVVRGMSLAKEFRVGLAEREVAFNQDLRALIPSAHFNSAFLAHYLRFSQHTVLALVDRASHGTTRLNSERLGAIDVPQPPLPEQRRIAEILDRADELREMRRTAAEEANGLSQAVFTEMFGDLRSFEHKWPLVRVSEAGRVQLGRQRTPKYQSGEHTHPYMRVANIYEDRIDLSDVLSMDFDASDFAAYRLVAGDILLNEGQSTELVGRPAMWRDEIPNCCFQNTLVRFQPRRDVALPEFALATFLAYFRSGEFSKISSKTSNVAHLGAARFAAMNFPTPPLQLQRTFVSRINIVQELMRAQNAATLECDEMFASVQQRAFSGAL